MSSRPHSSSFTLLAVALGIAAGTNLPLNASRGVARADDKDKDFFALLKIASDTNAKLVDREKALQLVGTLARNNTAKTRGAALVKELPGLLKECAGKLSDESYNHFYGLTLKAYEIFAPHPEAASLLKPFLGKGAQNICRMAALEQVEKHAAAGCAKELIAILDEPVEGDLERATDRDQLERRIVTAAKALPTDEAVQILGATIKKSKLNPVREFAIETIGNIPFMRPPQEVKEEVLKAALLDVVTNAGIKEPRIACAAALAMLQFNTYDGIGKLVERLSVKGGATVEVYKAFCQAAKKTPGFLDTPPERFNSLDKTTRAAVIQAMKDWYESVKGSPPETSLFEAMRNAKIDVPKDVNSKEMVTSLIEALDLDPREVRYAALNLLVRKTGRVDKAKEFKLMKQKLGTGLTLSIYEPDEGFNDQVKTDTLRALQKERAKEWRSWWQKASANATFVNGMWQTK